MTRFYFKILSVLTLLISANLHAQVIPDLLNGDHFRPYLSEQEKREQLLQSKTPHAQTSQEMYPQLYQNMNEDYMNPIRGTSTDTANAFKNKVQIGFDKSPNPINSSQSFASPFPSSVYQPGLSIQQRNMAMYEADLAAYEKQKQQSQQLVDEAFKAFEKPAIKYNLGVHTSAKSQRFEKVFMELSAMLEGKEKLDFLKATWLVESSLDNSLSWDEFNQMFQDDVQIISQLMIKDKLSPNDNLAKLMAIYKFMADTTTVQLRGKEKPVTTMPMLYDHEDFAAKKDITKVFVSKLLRTGTGQCMSLPMLYYLYTKALGAEAYIAFAPEHTYITFKDHVGNWQDIELTGRIFTTNDFYWHSGFIKAEQLKSGIYLRPISEKETIAYLITTLAITYVRTFGADDRLLDMAQTAHKYSPKSLTANMLMTGYSIELWKNVLRQYQVYGLSETDLASDTTAQEIKKQKDVAYNHIMKDLGYAKIPEWSYKQWLDGVNQLANRKQHIIKRRQLEHQLNRK